MSPKITLKSIKDFEEEELQFYIPSYQRGYRWKTKQVCQLIDDINSFQPTESNPFYFLQALAVSAVSNDLKNNRFNVVDGQQRLTTIKLILGENENVQNFKLSYAREADNDLDKHFKKEAEKCIEDRLGDNNSEARLNFCTKIRSCCRFLFYQVEKDKELSTFNELNSGKIAAKDSELVKCVMLSLNNDESSSVTQARATEWDTIERKLNDKEFFAFITPRNTWKEDDKMTVLLRYADISPEENTDEVFPFLTKIQNELKSKSRESVWKLVCAAYYRLVEWYNDPLLYHAFGAIIHKRGGCPIPSIVKGYDISKNIEAMSAYTPDDEEFDDYNGRNATGLYDYLLLSNVAFCWKRWPMRYSFLKHRSIKKWSLEHIFARNQKDLSKEELEKWIPSVTEEQIEDYKKKCEENAGNEWLSEKLKDKYPTGEDNSIKNLAMLPSNANSSLNNNLFEGKRDAVLNWANEGWKNYWVPPLTEAVFTKSLVGLNMSQPYWSDGDDGDKDSYYKYMDKSIKGFIDELKKK